MENVWDDREFKESKLLISFIFSLSLGETTNREREIKKCLTEAYKKTDDEFLHEASKA